MYENKTYTNSRLLRLAHSCSGARIPIKNIHHFIPALSSAIVRKVFGRHKRLPFIPYAAIPHIVGCLNKDSYVVEIGAGMSTLWLSDKSGYVDSYEWDQQWHKFLQDEIKSSKTTNVNIRLCQEDWDTSLKDLPDQSVDFLFIDGGPRSYCLHLLWPKLKRGRFAYLDNWDSDTFWCEGAHDARRFINSHSHEISNATEIVDFVPGYVAVSEGLLLKRT